MIHHHHAFAWSAARGSAHAARVSSGK